jgi:ATP-dependent helicase HepA
VRWYHEGLDAFAHTCPVGGTVLNALQAEFLSPITLLAREAEQSDAIIARTRALHIEQLALLERGRDRLLELHSCRPEPARALCEQIAAVDAEDAVYRFMESVFDCYGVHVEDHSLDCWIARPSDHMYIHQFPALPEAGCTLTSRRDLALQREDMQFLTWDHPLVSGALDLILHGGEGNVTLCAVRLTDVEPGAVLVEALFRLHCAADGRLNAARYLPPALLRVVVDANGEERSTDFDQASLEQGLERLSRHGARQLLETYHTQIRQLIAAAEALAEQQVPSLREQSMAEMQAELGAEWRRLAALARVNPSIRADELDALQDDMAKLHEALSQSRLQMEALRVLFAY